MKQSFATAVPCSAIADADVRTVAELVCRWRHPGSEHLTLDDVVAARAARAQGDGAAFDATQSEAAGKALTDNALDQLALYLTTGKGGLLDLGLLTIDGHEFHDVHLLPGSAADASTSSAAIVKAEEAVAGIGYDRVYLQLEDQRLAIALQRAGSLHRIHPGMRGQLWREEHRQTCTVLFVADVNNSLREATLGSVTSVLRRLSDSVTGRIATQLEHNVSHAATAALAIQPSPGVPSAAVATATTTAMAAPSPGGTPAPSSPLTNPYWLVGGVSLAAGAATQAPLVATVAGGAAVTALCLRTAEAVRNRLGRDKSALLHHIGVTLNRKDRIVH